MKRYGFFTLESLFFLLFTLVLVMLLWSSLRIFFPASTAQPGTLNFLDASEHLVFQLRSDFRCAERVEATANELCLFGPEQGQIHYRLASDSLLRGVGNGREEVLLSKLKDGGFSCSAATPRLVSIWLLPQDQQSVPFLTSFAVRGSEP